MLALEFKRRNIRVYNGTYDTKTLVFSDCENLGFFGQNWFFPKGLHMYLFVIIYKVNRKIFSFVFFSKFYAFYALAFCENKK